MVQGKIMEDFDIWLKEFHQHYLKSEAWQEVQRYNPNAKDLLGWYIQFKSNKDTKSLVKATWILAIATIILALATIGLIFVSYYV